MSSVYRLSKTGTKVLYKVRHHKGHGVHSPFVFNLINNVIEEKRPFYWYQKLEEYISQFRVQKLSLRKDNLLAFRLVNHFEAKTILEIGSGIGVNTLCLSAPASDITCTAIESNEEKYVHAATLFQDYDRDIVLKKKIDDIPPLSYDCIYLNLNNYNDFTSEDLNKLIGMCHEKSFIMVKGIRRSKKQNRLWKCLTKNEARTAELDLFDIGLLFFDKQLYRWKYPISF